MAKWGSLHGVVANVMDCDIVVSDFDLQSCCYVHFRTNTLGKGMNSLIPNYGLNNTITILLHTYNFGIK